MIIISEKYESELLASFYFFAPKMKDKALSEIRDCEDLLIQAGVRKKYITSGFWYRNWYTAIRVKLTIAEAMDIMQEVEEVEHLVKKSNERPYERRIWKFIGAKKAGKQVISKRKMDRYTIPQV